MTSENRKLDDLRGRIADASRNEKNGLLMILMGVFLTSAGLIISVIVDSTLAFVGGVLVAFLGVFSTMFGFYVSAHFAHQYTNLLRELDACEKVE